MSSELEIEVLMENQARIEKKLDEVIKLVVALQQVQPGALPKRPDAMSTKRQICPLCQRAVKYKYVSRPQTGGRLLLRVCECEPPPEADNKE
jgi:hypothetical protein